MNKKCVFIIIVSIMLITISIYTYTVIRSYDERVVRKNVIDFMKETNNKGYPENLMDNIDIIEQRKIGNRTFYIVHQKFNNLILKEWMNYPITEGLRLDDYVMIEKIDRFFTYPKYIETSSVLINNQNPEQCTENGICSFTYYSFKNNNELLINGINHKNASKIKLTFGNQSPIIIDVKGKPYILEIVVVEENFIIDALPVIEFIYD